MNSKPRKRNQQPQTQKRVLPHYDDSELTLYVIIDDELRAIARAGMRASDVE